MPLYEYACRSCGQHIEAKQSFNDPPLTVCVACGGSLRRLFQPPAIVFKGSGWYVTDSRPAASTSEAAATSTASSTSSSNTPSSTNGSSQTSKAAEKAA